MLVSNLRKAVQAAQKSIRGLNVRITSAKKRKNQPLVDVLVKDLNEAQTTLRHMQRRLETALEQQRADKNRDRKRTVRDQRGRTGKQFYREVALTDGGEAYANA